MNRSCFLVRFWLFLFILATGQAAGLAGYYPPAVVVSGLDPGILGRSVAGGGEYSGGYYKEFTYETTTTTEGYWDYTSNAGYYETQDQGYWDTSGGDWQDQGSWNYDSGDPIWTPNWVWVPGPPVWVPNPVSVWVPTPTWVPPNSTTSSYTASVYLTLHVSIDGSGTTTISCYNPDGMNTDYWYGTYDFSSGAFSGSIPTTVAVASDGTSWTPPPPPPDYASFGPASVWVAGTCFVWSYTDFADDNRSAGTDYYVDGAGHSVWVQSPEGGVSSAGGVTSAGSPWSATFTNGLFEGTGGLDVRAADSGGNYLVQSAPPGLPPAVRVGGVTALWSYLGHVSSLHHYAGPQADQRLVINADTGEISLQGESGSRFYSHNQIWSSSGSSDVRAVSPDGSPVQSDQTPVWGPPQVFVNSTLWRYAGTWDGTISFPVGTPPATGDHYLGDNANQRLVVDASGTVTVTTDGNGGQVFGTYAPQAQQEGAPRVFTVAGYEIYPGDDNGTYHSTQPAVGPPAVWVNEVTYAFSNSNKDAQSGVWTDTYADGNGNFLLLSATQVRSFLEDMTCNWSGTYAPATSSLSDGGIFVVVNGSPRYDVRASNGYTLLPPVGEPLHGPAVVKVDGAAYRFAGSALKADHYYGAAAGERLFINAEGAAAFTNTLNSPNMAGVGHFSGSVFMVPGHDLRACTADLNPVAAVGTPQFGPAMILVEGVVWPFLGAVADDALEVHADFYGGMNVGQVIRVDSEKHVSGAHTGVYEGGVFVVSGGTDLRALNAYGEQIPVTGTPVNGHPSVLRIGGLHWGYLGSHNDIDYYAAALGGQRLTIDASGNVAYSDRPHNVSGATGTYANGQYTVTSGGTNFNAGTIGGDLDVLGNVVSFGTLKGNSQTAGVTLQFSDDGFRASLQNSLSRAQTQWLWSRATSTSSLSPHPVMRLDSASGLSLENVSNNGIPTSIQINPSVSSITINSNPVLTEPSANDLYVRKDQIGGGSSSILTQTAADLRYIRADQPMFNNSPLLTQAGADTRYLRIDQLAGSNGGGGNDILTQSGADARYLPLSQPMINNSPVLTQSGADERYLPLEQPTINNSPVLTQQGADTRYLRLDQPVLNNSPVVTQESGDLRYLRGDQPLRVPQAGDIGMGEFQNGPPAEPEPPEEE